MKRFKALFTIIVACTLVLLTACSSNDPTGTYKLVSVDGKSADEYYAETGIDFTDKFLLVLYDNGRGTLYPDTNQYDITYVINGNNITIYQVTYTGESEYLCDGTIRGSQITLMFDNVTPSEYTFKKV